MALAHARPGTPPFEQWIPLARQVVRTSLNLGWKDVFEIYTYVPTIPLAEALALEARRAGSDTHLTLMTDDLWFTSMHELSTKWLSAPSPAEYALNETATAGIYLGGPADARRMRDIPAEKFDANATGGMRQDEPARRRKARSVDLPIGRVTPERAAAYGLDYGKWYRSYHAALAVDLKTIQKRGVALAKKLATHRKVRITGDGGTDLRFVVKTLPPAIDDGIISPADVRRGFVGTTLPAGKLEGAMVPDSVNGEVHAKDPIFFAGRTIVRPWFVVKRGRIVAWGADAHEDRFNEALKWSKVTRAKLGWFTIGLNPVAEAVMLDNAIVKDDVGVGLGPHPQLERRAADPMVSFYLTLGPVHVDLKA
ncbi:MAG: hypothetical protein E6K18_06890 [Methanobacteriota archaeon]|nr:MAG: hypothetical protein E6K18_06890 [Euryarchaeota archaeon]